MIYSLYYCRFISNFYLFFFPFLSFAGRPARTATATLIVDVKDINDNAPYFRDLYRPVVPENVDPPITVIELFADDRDTPPPTKPWFKFQLDDNAPSVIKDSFRVVFNRGKHLMVFFFKFLVCNRFFSFESASTPCRQIENQICDHF